MKHQLNEIRTAHTGHGAIKKCSSDHMRHKKMPPTKRQKVQTKQLLIL
jgi:hypothetical protein